MSSLDRKIAEHDGRVSLQSKRVLTASGRLQIGDILLAKSGGGGKRNIDLWKG
ncbi:MAG TPA: hypothetical protein VF461_01535 [Gemmatimonadaceae bacterium]